MFSDGELRQTANRLVDKSKNGEDRNPVWRLSEIIGDKSQVEFAIFSSYAAQVSWIVSLAVDARRSRGSACAG
ncbi:hypothetical protein OF83DRAFT_1122166 [Amylostereum chailletii]|nr:hypothetical protein OF83DRAFT_1122166 [Amylostereum chailletii]